MYDNRKKFYETYEDPRRDYLEVESVLSKWVNAKYATNTICEEIGKRD